MNRRLTNLIRYLMDEWLPPAVRDSRWFMRPFYWLAYRGKNIDQVMDFKTIVYDFTPEEYDQFYNSLDTISRHRPTDLNRACIDFILDGIHPEATNLLDVGCGHGFLLRQIRQRHPSLHLTGLDIKNPIPCEDFTGLKGNLESLPFPDGSFDVVTCCHTLEHLLDLDRCLSELIRVTRKQLFIVVPRQRYFYYTLDEHIHFFTHAALLTHRIPLRKFQCLELDGDWAYLGFPKA